jgi:hypothetical protein
LLCTQRSGFYIKKIFPHQQVVHINKSLSRQDTPITSKALRISRLSTSPGALRTSQALHNIKILSTSKLSTSSASSSRVFALASYSRVPTSDSALHITMSLSHQDQLTASSRAFRTGQAVHNIKILCIGKLSTSSALSASSSSSKSLHQQAFHECLHQNLLCTSPQTNRSMDQSDESLMEHQLSRSGLAMHGHS